MDSILSTWKVPYAIIITTPNLNVFSTAHCHISHATYVPFPLLFLENCCYKNYLQHMMCVQNQDPHLLDKAIIKENSTTGHTTCRGYITSKFFQVIWIRHFLNSFQYTLIPYRKCMKLNIYRRHTTAVSLNIPNKILLSLLRCNQ